MPLHKSRDAWHRLTVLCIRIFAYCLFATITSYMRVRRRFSVSETSPGNAFSHFPLVYMPPYDKLRQIYESMCAKLSYDMDAIVIVQVKDVIIIL